MFLTRRFAGSGGPFTLKVEEAARTLPRRPPGGRRRLLFDRYFDAAGVQRILPEIR